MSTHDPHDYVALLLDVLAEDGLTAEEVSTYLRALLYAEGMTPEKIDLAMLDRAEMRDEAKALEARTAN